jgi:hypothetical protein
MLYMYALCSYEWLNEDIVYVISSWCKHVLMAYIFAGELVTECTVQEKSTYSLF